MKVFAGKSAPVNEYVLAHVLVVVGDGVSVTPVYEALQHFRGDLRMGFAVRPNGTPEAS